MIEAAALGRPWTVTSGDEVNDWMYVIDAARAVLKAAEVHNTEARAITVGGEVATTEKAVAPLNVWIPGRELALRRGAATSLPSSDLMQRSGSWDMSRPTVYAAAFSSQQMPFDDARDSRWWCDVRITHVDVARVSALFPEPLRFEEREMETNTAVVVEVRDRSGLTGLGYAPTFGFGMTPSAAHVERDFAPWLPTRTMQLLVTPLRA